MPRLLDAFQASTAADALGLHHHALEQAGEASAFLSGPSVPKGAATAFTEPLQFHRNTGESIEVSGKSRHACIEDCQHKLKAKSGKDDNAAASAGAMMGDLVTGGEQMEIQDCVNMCRSEFEIFCFPGDATVHVRGRGRVPLRELRVGDAVMAIAPAAVNRDDAQPFSLRFDTVLAFLHHEPSWEGEVLELRHDLGRIRVTGNHLLYCASTTSDGSHGKARPCLARDVRVGDRLLAPWCDGDVVTARVTELKTLQAAGLYSPLLDGGNLLVDGTAASCYALPTNLTETSVYRRLVAVADGDGVHALAHAACAPLRTWCRAALASVPTAEGAERDKLATEKMAATKAALYGAHKDKDFGVHPYAWTLFVLASSAVRGIPA